MLFREAPSLSRLLDVNLTVEIVEGVPTNIDHLQTCTISIPAEDYEQLDGEAVEQLYLRPMVRALAEKINTLGNVRVAEMPLDRFKKEIAFSCTNGKIPVTLRIVRRSDPDRYQILIHALVQPTSAND